MWRQEKRKNKGQQEQYTHNSFKKEEMIKSGRLKWLMNKMEEWGIRLER